MKKNRSSMVSLLLWVWRRKTVFIMRLTFSICLFCVLQSFAIGSFSQNLRLSINQKNISIENVLQLIEDQTDYYFMYSTLTIDVKRVVDLEATNKLVPEILDYIFENTSVSYKINGRLIALSKNGDTSMMAQQIPVSGKVTDSSGAPLPGVSVVIKGTTNGTITDFDGKYTLANVPGDGTLVFSFVGMRTQEILVAGKTNINISMAEETVGIEEVVAIGYGTIKKTDLTGAVTTVQGDVIAQRQTMKVTDALQGALPGVTVTRSGNAPGANASIKIRGITTIGNNTPLVIIDGIPGSIDNVNPNDIESISVLKDAASASIYGSQAAAGVILITTKRAKAGNLDLTYSFESGVEKPTQMANFVGAVRNMQIQNEMIWNDNNNAGSEFPTYSQNVIENYASLHAENPDKYPDTDWWSFLLNDYAPRQSHNLSLNAGTNNVLSKISIGYDKNNALYDGRTYERITIRANNNIKINDYLSASVDLYHYRAIHNQPINSIGINSAKPPIYAAVWSDGRIAQGNSKSDNPYALLKYGGFNNSSANVYGGKFTLDLTPIKGLKLSASFAPIIKSSQNKKFNKEIKYANWDSPDVVAGHISGAEKTSLSKTSYEEKGFTSQFIVNYEKKLGENNLNFMAGNENLYNHYESFGASSDYLELSSYPYLDLANTNYLSVSGNANEYAYNSLFGRIMYKYKEKYLVQANARYDGSSRFSKDYRWGLFPSFSAGWVVSEESFMKNIKGISFFKIRASWGSLGNERIGNYPYQSSIAFGNSVLLQNNTPVSVQTATLSNYAVENISWETTETFDVGLDLNAFNNRLRITGDYYQKKTKDMLLALEIPDYIGLNNPDQNAGKMHTKGWDLELGWKDEVGKLRYSVALNISDYKSAMGDLSGTEFIGDQVKFEGSEYNEWYGYKTEGLFLTQEDLYNSLKINNSVKIGDIKYKDVSGPDGVPDGKISSTYDRVLLGGSLPRYLYGGSINLEYRNFDFLLVLQGVGKQNSVSQQLGLDTSWNFYTYFDGNYWSKYNSDEQNKKVKYPRLSYPTTAATKNYVMSDYWLINGAYFRVKNITLGYNIPATLTQKLKIQNVRIYASVSDPISFDHYPKGLDPETVYSGYWATTSYILGISVKF